MKQDTPRKPLENTQRAADCHFGIIVSRFNEFVTHSLLEGALSCLQHHGIPHEQVTVTWVPGALEIPFMAKKMALSGKYQALICLGAVIRGATYHFEIVCDQSAAGVMQVALDSGIPIANGILTTDTIEQALERAAPDAENNKGFEAAAVAIEMASTSQ